MERVTKVIKGLEDWKYYNWGEAFEFHKEILEDALSLLKWQDNEIDTLRTLVLGYKMGKIKTEAVKPITEHHLFLCPVCKNTLFREQKFCHECGKAIEWE